MRRAWRSGLREALDADPTRAAHGPVLLRPHGVAPPDGGHPGVVPDRVWDPPIAEIGYVGTGIGAAISGLRPIVDVATASFIFQAFSQVVNEAANIHYMTGGQTRVPMVIHVNHGIRGGGAAQHSHSPQAMLWNTPGLKIMTPSSARDVRGLLATAVDDDNPVLWADHVKLFDYVDAVPDAPEAIPFGVADIKRAGTDVTIVGTSLMVRRALEAAEDLAADGISAEVVDPRTLVPLDLDTILGSVGRTGRLVVVDECHRSCGVGAELSATGRGACVRCAPGAHPSGWPRSTCPSRSPDRWRRSWSPTWTRSWPPLGCCWGSSSALQAWTMRPSAAAACPSARS